MLLLLVRLLMKLSLVLLLVLVKCLAPLIEASKFSRGAGPSPLKSWSRLTETSPRLVTKALLSLLWRVPARNLS